MWQNGTVPTAVPADAATMDKCPDAIREQAEGWTCFRAPMCGRPKPCASAFVSSGCVETACFLPKLIRGEYCDRIPTNLAL